MLTSLRRTKQFTLFTLLSAVILASVLVLPSCQRGYSGKPESIVLAGLIGDGNIMFFTAENQHFFAANGIDFTFKTEATGVDTINDLLNNKIDIAGSTEYPMIANAFDKENISIIASVDKSFVFDLLGLTDSGIRNVADLKGKRIGLARGTIAEFYLGRFLNLNGMSIGDVTLINVPGAQGADAIANGSVDAVVTRDPYESQIREQHANGMVSWSIQSSQAAYSVLICRNDWITQHPDLVKRFLNSLAQAEGYIAQHPAGAQAILQKQYQYDNEHVAQVWTQNQFVLSLDQSLILAMEDEARWMMANNLTTEKTMPDFTNYIYTDGLKAVKPGAVNIVK